MNLFFGFYRHIEIVGRLDGKALTRDTFQVEPDSICLVLFNRAGVSLLFSDTYFWKNLQDNMWLYLKLAR